MSFAIVFPGQGSQAVGMLSAMAGSYPIARQIFAEASSRLGFDLWDLVLNGPEEGLNRTENTQPALLTAGYVIWRIWLERGGQRPALLAGHSLGEYTALVCAGALDFGDAVALVAERGRTMQSAVPVGTGAMAAILGLDDEVIIDICRGASGEEVVSAANFNSPGQVVIAGHTKAVEKAMSAAKAAGAKRTVLLPVSVPSHCPLMYEAAEKFSRHLDSVAIRDAEIPVVQNVDAEPRRDATAIKQALVGQLHQPVRWVESVKKIQSEGVNRIIECGPGKVLAGLMKRIDRELQIDAVYDPESLDNALKEES